MRIAHLSDFHFTKLTLNPLRLFPKRFFGHINWCIRRRKEFNHQQLSDLPDFFRMLKVDWILFGGDFTSSSLTEEFKLARNWVDQMPVPWIAVPGNHDFYTRGSARRFYKYFDPLRIQPIGNNWWVVPIDTSCTNPIRSARGLFSNQAELKKQLSEINGNVILLNHYPFFQQESVDRNLQGGEKLEELIREHPNVKLYLHGHTHRHSMVDLQEDNLPIILDSGSCSLKKGSWNLIDLTTASCNITPYFWENGWTTKETKEFLWKR